MKVAIIKDKEIASIKDFFQECGWLSDELRKISLSEVDFQTHYEVFNRFDTHKSKLFLSRLVSHANGMSWEKMLMNLRVLLDNCADPELDHLDFNKEIKAGFEAINLLKEMACTMSTAETSATGVMRLSDFKLKIQAILDKIPAKEEAPETIPVDNGAQSDQ